MRLPKVFKLHKKLLTSGNSLYSALVILACSFLSCLTPAPVVHATEPADLYTLSLDELRQVRVTSAARYKQAIEQAPSVINVISRQDIERYGAGNLLEVLQRFPGFVPVADPTFGARGAALRGDTNISAERILFLIDGRPFRSYSTSVYTNRAIYQTFPISTIERIELVRGPGSAVYGANAMTGIVNIITDRPDHSSTTFRLETGALDSNKATIRTNIVDQALKMDLTVEGAKSDGWKSDFETTLEPGQRSSYAKPTKSATLDFNLDYKQLSFSSLIINYDSNFVRPLEGTFDDRVLAQYRFYDLGYTLDLSPGWLLKTYGTYIDINDSQFDVSEESALVDISLEGEINSAGANLVSGISASRSRSKAGSTDVLGYDNTLYYYSIFTQLEQPLTPALQGHFGLQGNWTRGGDEDFSPRMGLIYQFDESHGVKLLYNEAFRTPTAAETDFRLYNPSIGQVVFDSNPDLKSETVRTLDLQWFNYQADGHTTLTAFHSQYHNRIENDFSVFPARFVQRGEVTITGLELEGRAQLAESNVFDFGWTWQRNEDENGVQDVTLAPRWILTTGYAHICKNGLRVSLFNQHVDAFKDNSNTINNPQPESYDLLSLNLSLSLTPWIGSAEFSRAELSFRVSNLLDEEIWQPALILPQYNSLQVYGGRISTLGLELAW